MLENATIVVGTDLTDVSRAAIEAAAGIAERFGAKKLVLAHGVKTGGPLAALGDTQQRTFDAARAKLESTELTAEGVEVERVARSGPPARVLVELAEERGAELIVVSSHGFGAIRRTLVGSMAIEVTRAAHCPVLVVGPDRVGRGPVESVTAAVDLSAVSERVARSALTFGCSYGAPVRMVSVFEQAGQHLDDAGGPDLSREEIAKARAELEAGLERLAQPGRDIDVKVETALIEGDTPGQAILADVEKTAPSLLVIGTSGHDGWHRLVLGATAGQLVCEASTPVLVVPAEAPALEGCASVS